MVQIIQLTTSQKSMDGDFVFEAWFKDLFLSSIVDQDKPIIMFFDGHGSHITRQAAVKAKEDIKCTVAPRHWSLWSS